MKNNNDKNIYDMFNDIEVDLSEYEKEDFNDIEKIKIKRKFRESIGKKNNTNYKKYISVASITILSLAVISLTPVGTYASKVISDLVFDIKSALILDKNKDNYIKVINKEITKDGISLRLNEAVINNDELIVSLTTIYEKEILEDMKIWRENAAKLYINGKFVDRMEVSSSANVSKNNIDEVLFFNLNTNSYSGVVDIKIEMDDLNIYRGIDDGLKKEKIIEGPFVFEFSIDTDKINKNMKSIELNKVIDFGNGEKISLNKFVYTPLSQKIYYTANDKALKNKVDIILKGKDDLGNQVEFDMYRGVNGVGELVANINGEKIDESAKYIILTAYKRTYEQDEENGKVKLEEIEKDIRIDINK